VRDGPLHERLDRLLVGDVRGHAERRRPGRLRLGDEGLQLGAVREANDDVRARLTERPAMERPSPRPAPVTIADLAFERAVRSDRLLSLPAVSQCLLTRLAVSPAR